MKTILHQFCLLFISVNSSGVNSLDILLGLLEEIEMHMF